ncbi:hypothetical protein DH2020_035899 [Rehmannia glutinosa]|uniref:Uncharacterized protein n=1 Tax=Rehmannia glutinosa TaxID=99300 RepID=A0ABR0V692_REHGL
MESEQQPAYEDVHEEGLENTVGEPVYGLFRLAGLEVMLVVVAVLDMALAEMVRYEEGMAIKKRGYGSRMGTRTSCVPPRQSDRGLGAYEPPRHYEGVCFAIRELGDDEQPSELLLENFDREDVKAITTIPIRRMDRPRIEWFGTLRKTELHGEIGISCFKGFKPRSWRKALRSRRAIGGISQSWTGIEKPEELVLSALMASTEEDTEQTVSETLQMKMGDWSYKNLSKRRRAERLTSNREDIGADETSEESVNDDEDDEDDENTTAGGGAGSSSGVRMLTPTVGSISNHHHHVHLSNHHHSHSSSFSQQQHNNNSTSNIVSSNHHLQHRKSFPPSSSSASKVLRAPPVWKSDEMISVSVPRKARTASTKRSHDWISSSSNNNSGGGGGVSGGDQNLGQPSNSPARQSIVPTSTPLPAAPMSPSSSNVSIRKKLVSKHSVNNTGPKLKPPKASSKPSSSNPEELEIEIAEVLYGLMTQSQGPSSSSKKEDSREVNRLNSDAKPLNSSPISNPTATNILVSVPNSSPLSAVAPKRKRPRQVPENSSYGARSSPLPAKPETDQSPKSEIPSPNLEKISGSATAENGFEKGAICKETRDLVAKEDLSSSKEKESPAVRVEDSNNRDSPSTATASLAAGATMIKANLMMGSEKENQKEEKFEIDLMAPPPQVRSSPERETKIDLRISAVDQKPVLSIVDADLKPPVVVSKDSEDDKGNKSGCGKDHWSNVAAEEKKCKVSEKEEDESHKSIENKSRNIDLRLDLEKPERDDVNATGNKSQKQQQPLKATREEQPVTEKSGNSVPLPMSMASWPGGLPPMGYMAPLQGVVSMDGGGVTPAHIQPLFSQPRPKRCATHCHIARNIHCLQQFMKMNPFWPPPAGSASLFGSKPCNPNVMPTADLHGNIAVRGVNNAQDKVQSVASIPNNGGKEKGSQTATTSDSAQRKQQILIQQTLPPVPPSNLLGPAFIFPLNQQHAAMAAARPSAAKSPTTVSSSNTTTSSATNAASAAAGAAATAMSFNYPNMGANETQYLAILQNNGYPFPIPTIIHQQLQHAQQSSTQSQQLMQAHQNASASSGSSSSQKHLQSHQQRPQSSGGSGNASLQNFASQKAQPSQQSHNQYMNHPSRPRHPEGEAGGEDSPSTTDNRGSRASMNIYGQNFAMPMHPQNFALMTAPAALASANSNQIEKKAAHQPQQQQGLKTGVDSLPPHSFAMSFGPINGRLLNSPEATRHNIQMMAAAAQVVAQKKNFRTSEDGKSGGGVESSATEDERKSSAGKTLGGGGVGQSIAF